MPVVGMHVGGPDNGHRSEGSASRVRLEAIGATNDFAPRISELIVSYVRIA